MTSKMALYFCCIPSSMFDKVGNIKKSLHTDRKTASAR